MKEWITGRNPVFEVLSARRREVFRLWIAQGAEEKGKLGEIVQLAAGRKLRVERVQRQQIERRGISIQNILPDGAARAAVCQRHQIHHLLFGQG